MTIVLIGYMGSGKTTVGRALAKVMDYKFRDLDQYIEEIEKTSISNLFATKGEVYFRKLEALHLNNILDSEDELILALGGGTPCYGNNIRLINSAERVVSVYLKSSVNTLTNRLKDEKITRPLVAHLKNDEELKEFVGKHLFERIPFYTQADFTVETDNRSIDEIVREIVAPLF